jgi:hypothetical protein
VAPLICSTMACVLAASRPSLRSTAPTRLLVHAETEQLPLMLRDTAPMSLRRRKVMGHSLRLLKVKRAVELLAAVAAPPPSTTR